MRILHIITTIDRGGAENQLVLLVREQVKIGHEVAVLPLKGGAELHQILKGYGAEVFVSALNTNPLMQVIRIKGLIKSFDVVHAHLPRAEILSALTRPKNFILSRHNCESFIPSQPGFFSTILSRIVQSNAKVVVAISETVMKYLVSTNEVTKEKIKVVRYGFDPMINYSEESRTSKLAGKIIIGTISRLVPQKDLKTLLMAFQIVLKEYPESRLAIIGDGILKEELHEVSESLGISNSIDWIGRTAAPLELMQQMDVFVMTSLYEGFGLVVLEAISQKVPVILSDNETFREIFSGYEHYLFQVGNYRSLASKIMEFIQTGAKSKIVIEQSEILSFYSPARMSSAIELIYEESIK